MHNKNDIILITSRRVKDYKKSYIFLFQIQLRKKKEWARNRTLILRRKEEVHFLSCTISCNKKVFSKNVTKKLDIYHDKICMLKRNYLNKWINNYTNLPASPCSSNSIGHPPHLLQICMTTNTLVRHYTSGKKQKRIKMMKEIEVSYQEKKNEELKWRKK